MTRPTPSAFACLAMVVLFNLGIAGQPTALKVVVIAGEDAVNIIQQKTAVTPVVEVRDRNDLPVAGAIVTFRIGGQGATFAGGSTTLSVTTNAAGRAVAAGLTPNTAGAIQIQATAAFQGETAVATITQTNVLTAQAAGAAAATTGGGGISGTMIGIIGAVAGGGALIATQVTGGASEAANTNSPSTTATTPSATPGVTAPPTPPAPTPAPPANRPPVIVGTISASPTTTIAGMPFVFSVSASDPDSDPLTYAWDFGDGSTSAQASPTYTYQRAGVFFVRVTVRDRDSSTAAGAELLVKSLTGMWRGPGGTNPGILDINQNSASTVTGTYLIPINTNVVTIMRCPFSGTISAQVITFDFPPCPNPVFGGFRPGGPDLWYLRDNADALVWSLGSTVVYRRQ